jgi:hypothetical protein
LDFNVFGCTILQRIEMRMRKYNNEFRISKSSEIPFAVGVV